MLDRILVDMSSTERTATRQFIEELISGKDAKSTRVTEKGYALFSSQLSESALCAEDVDLLISAVKFMLQHWETCCATQSSSCIWSDLCFYMTGWMCAAVRTHGDEAGLNRAIRNLQFSLSRAGKAEQVRVARSYLSISNASLTLSYLQTAD